MPSTARMASVVGKRSEVLVPGVAGGAALANGRRSPFPRSTSPAQAEAGRPATRFVLGGAQRLGERCALAQMAIERVEERRGVHVAQRPPTADHRVGAGLEEGAGEAEHAFAAQDAPAAV